MLFASHGNVFCLPLKGLVDSLAEFKVVSVRIVESLLDVGFQILYRFVSLCYLFRSFLCYSQYCFVHFWLILCGVDLVNGEFLSNDSAVASKFAFVLSLQLFDNVFTL